ncbi:zonular occludens toxin domain-containing protein [Comamonas endophytica]|uniref:zonular occludens toxin domain-containing protein n=1 Tax=Comamonas endophytica TaxID=2949090 RepID=UPI00360B4CB0
MLSELASDGRQLYVNGIPDLQIQHEPLAEPEKWPEVVPDGSVIIIDEVQRVWRPRGPGQKVPDHVAMLETHRHRGLDFYIITQGPNLVDSNVRALVGRHVHLRDLGILGRWWYEWPECADNCRTSWKNAPIKKRYRLPKRIFGQYKSASIHVKPVRSVPWMLAVMVVALLTVGGMSWVAYNAITDRMNPGGKLAAQQPEKPGVGVPQSSKLLGLLRLLNLASSMIALPSYRAFPAGLRPRRLMTRCALWSTCPRSRERCASKGHANA